MTYLLDTHTLIWFVEGSGRLSPLARTIVTDMSNTCVVSTASLWEIAIKLGSGKLKMTSPFDDLVVHRLRHEQIGILPIAANHLLAMAALTYPTNGHRDPFDRMLVCQALSDDLILISADSALDAYGVSRLW
ncbi:MAG: type II toxin-antitoxin system VapC family toxin [Planctomycetales bacterium]|nr:type II toxin-antitoxin system VapC family toxin [Planctomycetales bacterium]